MKRWYYYRLIRVWLKRMIKRHPLKVLLVVIIIAFGAGLRAYTFLEQYDWGKMVNTLFFTMLSSEASITKMYAQSKPFWVIISYVLAADACNILLDNFVVSRLIAWKFAKSKIDWFSRQLKQLWGKVKLSWPLKKLKQLWGKVRLLWPFQRKKSGQQNRLSQRLLAFRSHVNGIRQNPSKAGLGAVLFFAALPRIPLFIVGGVSVGVLIIRYNKFGYRGWIALVAGIIGRTLFMFGSLYGISSIF